jgi:YidC/Oxa1 family membrane protein insertase
MLWGAIELRHQPAFWGVFQLFGDWGFLRDLSQPDNFIKFADGGFDLPLCNMQITYSINILPILMAVVFYFQQKMTTPPPTNEQMAQQQKMMKWMTLLFPIMFYAAPSGLTLYIMSSSLAGIVDSYFVRKHIKAEEEAGTLFQKKPPKPGGFFDRVQKMIEAKQAEMAKNADAAKRPGGKRKR